MTLLAMSVKVSSMTDSISSQKACPIVRIEAERLPNMNIARSGHSAIFVNGEPTVIGGHTSGFVPTPTAEYLKDGEWHQLQTVYTHDGGFSIVMKSGKVLLAGGFNDNLGIGQTFPVENYDPATHSFQGFGCLDKKRVSSAAVELDSGRVLIVGNWYADDGMEMFDGDSHFTFVKNVSQTRSLPHVLKTSTGNVLVLAGYDYHGEPIDSIVIDRLHGESFTHPLFKTWRPIQYDLTQHSDDSFIGDEAEGDWRYLIPVKNDHGQLAIMEVHDTVFSLLPTATSIPMRSKWGTIRYITPVYADRPHQRGYIVGNDDTCRLYALCIDYSQSPAVLTLFHTDPLPEAGMAIIPLMTPEGNLMLTGGIGFEPNANFSPKASVWLLRFYEESPIATSRTNGWLWGGLFLAALIMIVTGIAFRKKPSPASEQPSEPQFVIDDELMQRIIQLMDEKKPYLSSELKVSDLADMLGTSSRNISDCIKNSTDKTFPNFINAYRIEYAKQLMHLQPNMKIIEVFLKSGFANETTFFRIFKATTGMTPNEWKASEQDSFPEKKLEID